MEKYELLVVAVVFQYSGIYAYNRQQLCDFTTKDLNSEFCLRIGETFRHEGYEYVIKNIHFAIEEKWFSTQMTLQVFMEYDNNPTNCRVYVTIDRI